MDLQGPRHIVAPAETPPRTQTTNHMRTAWATAGSCYALERPCYTCNALAGGATFIVVKKATTIDRRRYGSLVASTPQRSGAMKDQYFKFLEFPQRAHTASPHSKRGEIFESWGSAIQWTPSKSRRSLMKAFLGAMLVNKRVAQKQGLLFPKEKKAFENNPQMPAG